MCNHDWIACGDEKMCLLCGQVVKEEEQGIDKFINQIIHGDCLETLKTLPDNSVDSIVTDPPYELGFMGKKWDSTGIAYNVELWKRVRRVLKPGGYLISFGGARTYHRMVCAIEDAGFIIHPMIGWISGEGFPKAVDLSKQFDQQACRKELTKELGRKPNREEFKKAWENYRKIVGVKNNTYDNSVRNPNKHKSPAELSNIGEWGLKKTPHGLPLTTPVTPEAQQWIGWYYGLQSLKPAIEPICMAQKPIDSKRMTDNVLKWGTGGINIDDCRIELQEEGEDKRLGGKGTWKTEKMAKNVYKGGYSGECVTSSKLGRFPANVILDEEAGRMLDEQHKGASRFFYCAKASKKERGEGNNHPTVKPIKLMEYLITLITPPNGIVLDPFFGTGTTGIAAVNLGFNYIGFEISKEYFDIACQRLDDVEYQM